MVFVKRPFTFDGPFTFLTAHFRLEHQKYLKDSKNELFQTEMVSSRELGYFFNKMGTPYTQNQLRVEVEQMDSKYLDHR